MRAVVCHETRLELAELPTPEPGRGQVLIDVARCGICGSDLHARHHCDELAEVLEQAGYPDFMRSSERVVFGHEFSGTVAEYGAGCRKQAPAGAPVVALPLLRADGKPHAIGLSTHALGAYAEHIIVEESLMLPVPNGLSLEHAALTEPMAIAWHAVRRGDVGKRDVAIVIGCGPIGLAVITMLRARGVKRIVASDFSPVRRALALRCGAEVAVDPLQESPYVLAAKKGKQIPTIPAAVELAIETTEKLRRLPLPWHHVWRAAQTLGLADPPHPIIFECVGVPGIIDGIIAEAPMFSRVVVVGVCMGSDAIRPSMAINKEIDLRFVVGYTPLEFRDTLHLLADGKVDPTSLLTGTTGLPGVETAFDALGDLSGSGSAHAKILIDPKRSGTEIQRSQGT